MTTTSLNMAPKWVKCRAAVDDQGFLNVFIEGNLTKIEVNDRGPRQVQVGFSGFGYYLNTDLASRVGLIENLLLAAGMAYDR